MLKDYYSWQFSDAAFKLYWYVFRTLLKTSLEVTLVSSGILWK